MDAFGFTKKKLASLSVKNQNRHIIDWLSRFYQQLISNRVTPDRLELFTRQYTEILNWTGMPPFQPPGSDAQRAWIEAISDRIHYHRLALGIPIRDTDLADRVRTGDSALAAASLDTDCHIALDGLRSLFNVGSVFRICDATGFSSVILGNVPGKEHPGVCKTSMGAQEWISQEKTGDLAGLLMKKKETGYRIIGVETVKGSLAFDETTWTSKTIVVFGNEEYGLSSHVMDVCDAFVHIPLYGRKNSINVAAAVSVICFHATRHLTRWSPGLDCNPDK